MKIDVQIIGMCLIVTMLAGCASLDSASAHYRQHRDYRSLKAVARHLTVGMPKSEVEKLLGIADFSPVEGQFYYYSDRAAHPSGDEKPTMTFTLVVDYNRYSQGHLESRTLTDNLQQFWTGPVGE